MWKSSSSCTLTLLNLILVGLLAVASCPAFGQDAPTVNAPYGKITGINQEKDGVKLDVFLGIRFGETTGKDNRWLAPKPVTDLGDYTADSFKHSCPQLRTDLNINLQKIHDLKIKDLKIIDPESSEDCLFLNIWKPAKAEGTLPVMVYVYGGAFLTGSGSIPLYNGSTLAAKGDVIVVSFNYRLGAFGFLAYTEGLSEAQQLGGNFGFQDQQLALEWVKKNIGAFGGDTNNITLFGESAGAMSVGFHLVSAPGSEELFDKAIMESNPLGIPYKTLDQAATVGKYFMKFAGGLEKARQKSAEDILRLELVFAASSLIPQLKSLAHLLVWTPNVDGVIITSQPLESMVKNKFSKKTIIGTNKDEGTLFSCMARRVNPIILLTYPLNLFQLFDRDIAKTIIGSQDPYWKPSWILNPGKKFVGLSQLITDLAFSGANQYAAVSQDGSNVYAYEFTQLTQPPNNLLESICKECNNQQVCHGAEIPYVFQTFRPKPAKPPTEEELAVSNTMLGYWTHFAHTGAPAPQGGSDLLPTWDPVGGSKANYMIINRNMQQDRNPFAKAYAFWQGKITYEKVFEGYWDTAIEDMERQLEMFYKLHAVSEPTTADQRR